MPKPATDRRRHCVQGRLQELRAELGTAQLLAVCKRQPLDRVLQAVSAGQLHLGENYLQQALPRIQQLRDMLVAELPSAAAVAQPVWHFVGQVQRNKAARVGSHFDWVHALDRAALIPLLGRDRDAANPLNVCVQIRFAGQPPNRGGVEPERADELLAQLCEQGAGLKLRGLMCMASPDGASAELEFAAMQKLFANLRGKYPTMDTLCMGTSRDWRLAVAHGSTMVRIGEALFGPRTSI